MTETTLLTTPNGKIRKHVYAVVTLALLSLPFIVPEFQVYILAQVALFAVFGIAFNLLYGYTGLLSFGHALFVSFAGYSWAVFYLDIAPMLGIASTFGGTTPLAMIFIGGIVALIATLVITVPVGWLSVRLREIYFAMITLSFSMLFYALAQRDVGGWSNGIDGRTVIMGSLELLGHQWSMLNPKNLYILIILVAVPAIWMMWRIVNSPFGEISKAVRENPERVDAIGINHRKHSWYMFTLSGMFSAITGIFFVPLRTFIDPNMAFWSFSAEPVLMTVVGGPTNFLGPVAGAFILRYLRWFTGQYPILNENWELFMGLVVILIVMFFKGGVVGAIKAGLKRLQSKSESGSESAE